MDSGGFRGGNFNKGLSIKRSQRQPHKKCTHLKTFDNDFVCTFVCICWSVILLSLYKGVDGEAILDLLLRIHYVLLRRREFWESKRFYALFPGAFQEVLVMSGAQVSARRTVSCVSIRVKSKITQSEKLMQFVKTVMRISIYFTF